MKHSSSSVFLSLFVCNLILLLFVEHFFFCTAANLLYYLGEGLFNSCIRICNCCAIFENHFITNSFFSRINNKNEIVLLHTKYYHLSWWYLNRDVYILYKIITVHSSIKYHSNLSCRFLFFN